LAGSDLALPDGRKATILQLNEASWEVMRGTRQVKLLQLVRRKRGEKVQQSKAEVGKWDGVDRGLFEALRGIRRELAAQLGKPPYIIFADDTLRELARLKPQTLEAMRQVRGVGDRKLSDFGERFVRAIVEFANA
jgi:ATP-dependent DNA helicase RecQ